MTNTSSPNSRNGSPINLFTMGFTQKDARRFFTTLREAGVQRVVDVRLNNVSQLAGFTKRTDLEYFLKEIAGIEYIHLPELAPTKDMLDAYKKPGGNWALYEDRFLQLMAERRIDQQVAPQVIDGGCLLCSEPAPHQCHRRLVAEFLQRKWGRVSITHL